MAKFCSNCGTELNEMQDICLKCGVRINKETTTNNDTDAKSKIAAAVLALFLGNFGVHNFYLGYTGKAVTQLLLTILGFPLAFVFIGFPMIMASSIWAFVEAIMIFTGGINKDAKGNALKD